MTHYLTEYCDGDISKDFDEIVKVGKTAFVHDCGKGQCNRVVTDKKTNLKRLGAPGHGVVGALIIISWITSAMETSEVNDLIMMSILTSIHMLFYGNNDPIKMAKCALFVQHMVQYFPNFLKMLIGLGYGDDMGKKIPDALKPFAKTQSVAQLNIRLETLESFVLKQMSQSQSEILKKANCHTKGILAMFDTEYNESKTLECIKDIDTIELKSKRKLIYMKSTEDKSVDDVRSECMKYLKQDHIVIISLKDYQEIHTDKLGKHFSFSFIETMIKQGEGKRVDSKLARGSVKNADISLPFHPNIVKMIITI